MLRPGLHVVRRDVRTLQLGLEWPGLAALPDTAAVRAVLAVVDGFRDLTGVLLAAEARGIPRADLQAALTALLDSGALVDQHDGSPAGVDPPTWGAWWLMAGPTSNAAAIAEARGRHLVFIDGDGRLADRIVPLLAGEHVRLTHVPERASLSVVVSDQEPSRDRCDDAMRRGAPYLVVGIRELVGLVGPFVVPGRSACLHCVDRARAARDPCWPTVVDGASSNPPASEAGPPALLATVAGYAVQEVATYASGGCPVTWDNVVEIPYGPGRIETLHYEPHPECGCGWKTASETMSA